MATTESAISLDTYFYEWASASVSTSISHSATIQGMGADGC